MILLEKKKIIIITLLLITQTHFPTTIASDQQIKHVVLIAVDCVNPSTLQQADTPNIDSLIASGSYTYDSCTVTPANTISAIPAIFTGAPQEVHQLYEWTGTMQAESIVEVFEESGYTSAIVGESENLGGYAASYCTGFNYRTDHDDYYFDIAVDWLVEYEPFFMFIYNPIPDRAGHQYGLGSEEYQAALESADYHIGRVIETLQDQGVYDETLIVITTDHSLEGTSHSRGPTFSIWKGPGIKEDYEMDDSSEYVTGYGWVSHTLDDVAPTILDYLGLRPLSDGTGEVISSIYQQVSEPEPEFPPLPPLPPILSYLTITPAEVESGDEVTIGLDIENIDSQSFTYIVTMQIGDFTLLVDVELGAYESKTVSRIITPDMVGVFNVTVDGMTGSFTVGHAPLPAEFVFSNLVIVPGDWISIDETRHGFTIYVDVTNVGEEMGGCTVELKVNGEVVDSVEIPPFGGGVTATQFFNLTRSEGTYEVEVEGLTGSFTVVKPEPSFWDKIPGFPYVSIILGLLIALAFHLKHQS